MTTKDKFHNKNGTLTAYAFSCGYCEKAESKDTFKYMVTIANPAFESESATTSASMYQDGRWHVRVSQYNQRLIWESFDTLGQARKYFAKMKKEYKNIIEKF